MATVPRTAVSGSLVTISAYRLWALIASVYQVETDQVIGGPDWLRDDLYDIVARAPDGMHPKAAEIRHMIQSLLADRFQLKMHRETRIRPVYLLTLAKNGPKMKRTAAAPFYTLRSGDSVTTVIAESQTMSQFARVMSGLGLGRTVLDRTGLTAAYDFTLRWSSDLESESIDPSAPPSIFVAIQEQLGLKLTSDQLRRRARCGPRCPAFRQLNRCHCTREI